MARTTHRTLRRQPTEPCQQVSVKKACLLVLKHQLERQASGFYIVVLLEERPEYAMIILFLCLTTAHDYLPERSLFAPLEF